MTKQDYQKNIVLQLKKKHHIDLFKKTDMMQKLKILIFNKMSLYQLAVISSLIDTIESADYLIKLWIGLNSMNDKQISDIFVIEK